MAEPDPDDAGAAVRGGWTGGLLRDTVEERADRMAPDAPNDSLPSDVLQVVKRSKHVAEGAARSITGADGTPTIQVTARHYWNACRGRVVRPAGRMDTSALAALASLSQAEHSMLMVFAGQLQHWPDVVRWGIARGHRVEAICAAGDRILWTRPDRTLADHAWRIGMRQQDFRTLVKVACADLDRLLFAASERFDAALGGTRKHPANDFIGRDNESTAIESEPLACRAA